MHALLRRNPPAISSPHFRLAGPFLNTEIVRTNM
jgi:hypothetical protein